MLLTALVTWCDLFNGILAQGTPLDLLCFQELLLLVLFKPRPLLKPKSPWDQLVLNCNQSPNKSNGKVSATWTSFRNTNCIFFSQEGEALGFLIGRFYQGGGKS